MCNYLIHNTIKIFIFFLKIVVFIKNCRIFASLTTNTNNKNKEIMTNEEHCKIIEEARQDFMKGKITAAQYWNIRKNHMLAILENNKKINNLKKTIL